MRMLRRCSLVLVILTLLVSSALTQEKYQEPGLLHLDRDGEGWAAEALNNLSLEEKVGQLFMIRLRAESVKLDGSKYLQLRDTIVKYHIGSCARSVRPEGPFLYGSHRYETVMLLNRLQEEAKLPLLIAADFERGVPARLFGTTVFPHAMAFGAAGNLAYAEEFGRITAQEARAIGVHWNLFPVADVNSNPANPIINTRAFGEDPAQVSSLVSAYIKGARQEGMLTTAKHFPGHGDTGTDSHLGLAAVTRNREQIEQIDLVPFRSAIASGVDSVMVAHVTAPALEPDASKVATTSPAMINGLLKQELKFSGLVVTDAMEMGALTRLYPEGGPSASARAAVDAINAGNDMLLLPSDLDGAYNGLL